jgi:hypothetical protein
MMTGIIAKLTLTGNSEQMTPASSQSDFIRNFKLYSVLVSQVRSIRLVSYIYSYVNKSDGANMGC